MSENKPYRSGPLRKTVHIGDPTGDPDGLFVVRLYWRTLGESTPPVHLGGGRYREEDGTVTTTIGRIGVPK